MAPTTEAGAGSTAIIGGALASVAVCLSATLSCNRTSDEGASTANRQDSEIVKLGAEAAERRAEAARIRGIGSIKRAAEMQQSASSSAGTVEEPFGAKRRRQLREALDKSRKQQDERRLADARPDALGEVSATAETPPWQCSAERHACLIDVEQGCASCQATCHADCSSELCPFQPCAFCLSHSVAAPLGSSVCLEVQRASECTHTFDSCPPSTSVQIVVCTTSRHVCREDRERGCEACSRTCHKDTTSPLCGFFGRQRSDLPLHSFSPNDRDLLDTRMLQQELGGRLKHRTEFHWQGVGRDEHGRRIVLIDGSYYYLGASDGSENDCLIHSLRQCVGVMVNVPAIRRALMQEFSTPCGPTCHPSRFLCSRSCSKVHARNFLGDELCSSILRLLGKHCVTGRIAMDPADFCIRIIELTWQDNGIVLGNPTAPHRLTLAREGESHFIPALHLQIPVGDREWQPW